MKITIQVCAREKFSSEQLAITNGEIYLFQCGADETWTDWNVQSSPDGFDNKWANFFGLRVKNVKCFCLCGNYNHSRKGSFAIGSNKEVVMTESGELSFFSNDTKWAYFNNSGSIKVTISRIK